jgi:hypothetical protein
VIFISHHAVLTPLGKAVIALRKILLMMVSINSPQLICGGKDKDRG